MSKALLKKLPKDRPFSEVEAAFSLQVAHDCRQEVSVAGLASRWAWSRGRVKRFIMEMGGGVSYQKDTSNLQNQRGQIVIQIPDRYRTDNEQIRLYENNNLPTKASRYRTDTGQIPDRSSSTIINPNPNTDPKKKDSPSRPVFISEELWVEFLKNRTFKKLQNTEFALKVVCGKIKEAIDQGYTAEECIGAYVSSKMQRFNVDWLDSNKRGGNNDGETDEQRFARLSKLLQDGKALGRDI